MDLLEQMFGQKEETDEMSLYDQHAYIDHNEYKKRFTKVIHNTHKNLAVFFCYHCCVPKWTYLNDR